MTATIETETTERTRTLITGSEDPDERYPLPDKSALRAGDGVIRAHDLGAIARALIESDDLPFAEMAGLKIAWLWSEKGGLTGGFPAFGRMSKESKIHRHFSGFDYVASLAVDHLTTIKATRWQVEALVSHQLGHIACETTEKGEDRYGIKGHDFEGFGFEFDRYGVYLAGQVSAAGLVAQAVQLGMVWEEEEEEEEEEEFDPAAAYETDTGDEPGPVPDGPPAADWAEMDGAARLALIRAEEDEHEVAVRTNFGTETVDGIEVCRQCGIAVAAHNAEVCAGGTPAKRRSRRKQNGAAAESEPGSDVESRSGQLSASGANLPSVDVPRSTGFPPTATENLSAPNGSHAADDFATPNLDPDRVCRTLSDDGWAIAYQTTIDGGTGHYLNPQTGDPYGTDVVEGAYRALVVGR